MAARASTSSIRRSTARPATTIASGAAPFTGSFQPASALSAFNGKGPNGTWKLLVVDTASPSSGTVVNWSLQFTTNAGEPFVESTDGNYQFTQSVARHAPHPRDRLGRHVGNVARQEEFTIWPFRRRPRSPAITSAITRPRSAAAYFWTRTRTARSTTETAGSADGWSMTTKMTTACSLRPCNRIPPP